MAGDAPDDKRSRGDDGLDEGLPPGSGQGVADGKDLDGAVLLAGASGVARKYGLGRLGIIGNNTDGVV